MDNNNDNISTLSSSSSRSEHIAYLVNEVGLGRKTASLLYRAERLQEKGQLKLALKYFQQVLEKHPDCHEAQENARMTSELLQEEESQKKLETIAESKETAALHQKQYVVTEMEVHWIDSENIQFDYHPDADRAAFHAAKTKLNKTGHGNSLLKLIQNKTLTDVCNAETGWEEYLSGIATFQVTLLRDKPDESPSDLEQLLFSRMMAASASNNGGQTVPRTSSGRDVRPTAQSTNMEDSARVGGETSSNSISTQSRFADSESDVMAGILVRNIGSKSK